ncbi:MAG: HEAT repeat domain-containing protein [Armatimonadota bacterium]|nr:HEAT repeat domain-containing protein [Armatimonadota bacterium]MCX7777880.1 HEAT repeat domain-containing protein [Armatimonadota bacterium]MDW8025964.1 HEAT repeat domain-containing protein [Armatimonadota bacterium]
MRLALLAIKVVTLLCLFFMPMMKLCAAGETQVLEEPFVSILKGITSEDIKARMSAFERVRKLGMDGVKQLVHLMPQLGEGKDGGVRLAIHGLVTTFMAKGFERERKELSVTLCELLKTDLPKWVKRFLIEQLQLIGGEEAVNTLSAQLADEELAESARQALQANPSKAALDALREWLPKAKGNLRIGIINALGERRDLKALKLLMTEAKSKDADVRCAALEAVGRLGNIIASDLLLNGLKDSDTRVRRSALSGLLVMGEHMVSSGLKGEALKAYCEALKLVNDSRSRRALLTHIIPISDESAVESLATCLNDPEPHVRTMAMNCLREMKGEGVSSALSKLMDKADERERALLTLILGARKDKAAMNALKAAANDKSDAVKVAALHSLGKLEDRALEGTLLNAATADIEEIHEIALRAYLALARKRLNEGDSIGAAKMFMATLRTARNVELLREALVGIGETPVEEAIKLVEELLTDASVGVDAMRSYALIASRLAEAGQKERAEQMLLKLAGMSLPRDVANNVVAILRKLRPELDLAAMRGFVTSWWVIGPFAGTDIDAVLPPEKRISLDEAVKLDGVELKWQRHRTADIDGFVDLMALFKPNQNVTAYMYAEIDVENECDALFKFGSDDSIKCWLNGKLVHRYPQPRSPAVDQDVVKVRLQAGINRILLKVINFGGGWCATLRVTDAEGRPLRFTQK